ncbi:hypothetical protein IE53DRAFT_104631 [Violaceomyces palustris]|uniref:Uncharacterized protein n=1 Tax=Violaceomyces palustris TaxID=1673888 RepID=A0ACD0P6Y8_9BASI|nr:hypothetical protein IE53DRAFT_104631 [Violaceomyces palustris]
MVGTREEERGGKRERQGCTWKISGLSSSPFILLSLSLPLLSLFLHLPPLHASGICMHEHRHCRVFEIRYHTWVLQDNNGMGPSPTPLSPSNLNVVPSQRVSVRVGRRASHLDLYHVAVQPPSLPPYPYTPFHLSSSPEKRR